MSDIDLNVEDFINRVNVDLVGKLANLASRCGPMLSQKLGGRLGRLDEVGKALFQQMFAAREYIILADYESLNYASVIRTALLADVCNRFVEDAQPWATLRAEPEGHPHQPDSGVLNAVKVLTIYLKPILPAFAERMETFLNIPSVYLCGCRTAA